MFRQRTLPVADNRFYPPGALRSLVIAARDLARRNEDRGYSAAEYRAATGIGCNATIKVLEFFGSCGRTRRAVERRRILRQPQQPQQLSPVLRLIVVERGDGSFVLRLK